MPFNYFDEQIEQGKPIVPPTPAQAPFVPQGAQMDVPQAPVLPSIDASDPVAIAQAALDKAKVAVEEAKKAQEQQVVQSRLIQTKQWSGLPVRAGGDKIFILKGGKKFWVTSPEAYQKLGFKFGDESKLDEATLQIIPEGEPIR